MDFGIVERTVWEKIRDLKSTPAPQYGTSCNQVSVADILLELYEEIERIKDHLHDKFGERP